MPQDKHILVVDDEPSIQHFVKRNLELRAFKVSLASNGLEALAQFEHANFALIILDIMMPGMDGLEVCRRIRQCSTVPIIILTALGEEADKIEALDAGADDYLTKPFGVGELLARVRAVLRRKMGTGKDGSPVFHFGDVEVDQEKRIVRKAGADVHLTPIEYRLLSTMISNLGRVLTHRQILREVWGPSYVDQGHYVRIHMAHLRQKLEDDPAQPKHLVTGTAIGYRLVP